MESKTSNRILVIPAAGEGVRFRELGKRYPKGLLPYKGVPILVHMVRSLTSGENEGVFSECIIATGSEPQRQQIEDVMRRFDFTTRVTVIDINNNPILRYQQGPGTTLGLITSRVPDADVTIVLSDMLPKTEATARYIARELPADSIGVVEKPVGDFARWCMVGPSEDGGVTFYDKPTEQPPTRFAAVGVYRFSHSAWLNSAWREIMNEQPRGGLTSGSGGREIQFSHVFQRYQENGARIRAMVLDDDAFLDFGTLEEYLSHKGISKTREFNTVIDEGDYVCKISETKNEKVASEAVWLYHAPKALKKYLPRIEQGDIDLQRGMIKMEKIRSSNLRDVALYLDKSYETWTEVFTKIKEYLNAAKTTATSGTNEKFWEDMYKKTQERTIQATQDGFATDADLAWVQTQFRETIDYFKALPESIDPPIWYHGDLHFANMFYCFHYRDLKVIDPRGEVRGSLFYDLAKLAHTALGKYDYIDSQLYTKDSNGVYTLYDNGCDELQRAFRDVILEDYKPHIKHIMVLTASLFLSMIPLHGHSAENQTLFYDEYARLVRLVNGPREVTNTLLW